ncbi:hypothetical protein [Chryseobacterium wangxinyae]|uniref:hypothetical protein n=1 Tax=Chryseobacterium sp. CY353 TaxID=2997334 RepID=UPI00226DB6E8|nr:hypothetical protein [Chryseobacterium sp. CY353]MCY0970849.1 hypothetical protein [Chryseobacterium sp. CY353]
MKKYIKILGLAAIVPIQSCEGSAGEIIPEKPEDHSVKFIEKESLLKTNSKESLQDPNISGIDTGDDDDEPKRDKSHWRIAEDTIW